MLEAFDWGERLGLGGFEISVIPCSNLRLGRRRTTSE